MLKTDKSSLGKPFKEYSGGKLLYDKEQNAVDLIAALYIYCEATFICVQEIFARAFSTRIFLAAKLVFAV